MQPPWRPTTSASSCRRSQSAPTSAQPAQHQPRRLVRTGRISRSSGKSSLRQTRRRSVRAPYRPPAVSTLVPPLPPALPSAPFVVFLRRLSPSRSRCSSPSPSAFLPASPSLIRVVRCTCCTCAGREAVLSARQVLRASNDSAVLDGDAALNGLGHRAADLVRHDKSGHPQLGRFPLRHVPFPFPLEPTWARSHLGPIGPSPG
jgi:hypothetical protein